MCEVIRCFRAALSSGRMTLPQCNYSAVRTPRLYPHSAVRTPRLYVLLVAMTIAFPGFALSLHAADKSADKPWKRHTIDDSSRGADGVKVRDVNGDGRMDIVTGWEEGGVTRVYLDPGGDAVKKLWPAVTVGKTPSAEDAMFVDLDADGNVDVVSSCEGGTKTMFVHWAPEEKAKYLDPAAWKTEPLPASQKKMAWMFCVPMQVDGLRGVDLVAAAKGKGAQIGWFESPKDPWKLGDWRWHPISPAGWVMSLRTVDMDGDGDLDVVASDRRGELRGCRWLENPGPGDAQKKLWGNHWIGGQKHENMFLTIADLNGDRKDDVIVAVKGSGHLWMRRGDPAKWTPSYIAMPNNMGSEKGVAIGDIDGDGRLDLVQSCEHASGEKSGVAWLSYDKSPTEKQWTRHEISGPEGIKFDRIELLDLDGDGDLDVLTCEESQPVGGKRHGLGVFWYENPTK